MVGDRREEPGTWALEVVWAVAGLVLVVAHRWRFPLTRLVCWQLR